MENKVNITVMLENGKIQGVKANDYLFFKHEDENEVDFYNKRVIPLLREKNINFIRYYNYGYVDVIEEEDYEFLDTDIVTINKKQMGNILKANYQGELHYDEQLYLVRLYEKEFNKKYDYINQTTFKEAQNIVFYELVNEFYEKDFEEVLKEYFDENESKTIRDNQRLMIVDGKIFYNWSTRCIEGALYELRRENDIKNQQVEEKLVSEEGLLNVKCYVNNCREDVLSGKQILLQQSSYNIGNMYGASNVGKKRDNQQDSYVILEHPHNKEFKLLAVADGVGGHESGEIVSNHTVKKLIKWFESQDSSIMNDMKHAKILIDDYLQNILGDLSSEIALDGGTTLVVALVGNEETLIVNIGDSRAYTMKNGKLKQETRDHSKSQILYEAGILDEHVMRFYKDNNMIHNALDKKTVEVEPDYKIISNQSYDKILLVSDGVSDCLSQEQISRLMVASKKEKLAENIVEGALNTDSVLPKEYRGDPLYKLQIQGGKDNTTAVYYDMEEASKNRGR